MVAKFILVKCIKCGSEQKIFNKPAMVVKCLSCGETLALPTGGKAALSAKFIKELE